MEFLNGRVKQGRRPSKEEERLALWMFNKPYKDLSEDDRRRLQLKMQESAGMLPKIED